MKPIYKLAILLFSLLTLSCSSDDTATDGVSQPQEHILNLSVNGEDKSTYVHAGWKTENTLEIIGSPISFQFDRSGKLATAQLELSLPSGEERRYYNFRDFSDNYFDFEVSFDDINQRVTGTFSGFVYFDPENQASESKFVSGTFSVGYVLLIPSVGNKHHTAKIEGAVWKSISSFQHNGIPTVSSGYQAIFYAGDPFRITILYQTTVPLGTYLFTSVTPVNAVRLSKYNPDSQSYTDYDCTGSVVLTQNEAGIRAGTYSFTAVNPNNPSDIIEVTDGDFKFVQVL